MRYFLHIILLLLIANASFGQRVERRSKESAEQLVSKYMPEHSKLAFNVLDTMWNGKPVIIAFFEQGHKLSMEEDPGQQTYHRVIGEVFFKNDGNDYTRFLIDTIKSEGGDPKIENVFFANADKGRNKELIVLVSWPQLHADVSGTLYGAFVFDDYKIEGKKKLRYLENISRKLSGSCDCEYKDGKKTKAKLRNEADIRAELRRLGYR